MKNKILSSIVIVTLALTLFNTYMILSVNSKIENFFNSLIITVVNETPSLPPENNQTQQIPEVSWRNDCDKELNSSYDAIFVYWTKCPHCTRMEPYVANSTIKFYWVSVTDLACHELNLSEYGYQGFVPYFRCLRKNMSHTGEFIPIEAFYNWTKECVA